MLESLTNQSERLLEPMERISEVLFGLIMVLTFTCSFSVAAAGREEVRRMLIGALGCNLAWGIIDGVFYLMGNFSVQGRGILQLRAVRRFADPSEAHRVIACALPPLVASVLSPAELEVIRQKLNQLPVPPVRPHLSRDDGLGALYVFLIVFVYALPVVLPFTRHERTQAGVACFERNSRRNAVSGGLSLWALRRSSSVEDGPYDGDPGQRHGWDHHLFRRITV